MYDNVTDSTVGFTETPEVKAIMAKHEEPDDGHSGSVIRFSGLTVGEAAALLALLPGWQAEDRQNEALSFSEFVELGERYPEMTFHGYHVPSRRTDERITIEGFELKAPLTKSEVVELTRLDADEFSFDENADGTCEVYAWWD